MRNKLMKLMCMMSVMMFGLTGKVFAFNAGVNVSQGVGQDSDPQNKIVTQISTFVKPISAILVFAAVVMVGFEIIMNRNKADERMESMSSLMWVGIGALGLGLAGTIFSMLAGAGSSAQ